MDKNNEKNKSHWIVCPICKGRTKTKVRKDTVLLNFPLYCHRCKEEFIVGIIKLKMYVSSKPDA